MTRLLLVSYDGDKEAALHGFSQWCQQHNIEFVMARRTPCRDDDSDEEVNSSGVVVPTARHVGDVSHQPRHPS